MDDWIRIIGQIRYGRTEEQKMRLLRGMYECVLFAMDKKAPREIQTQIVEIDDTKTVMTNGILNA